MLFQNHSYATRGLEQVFQSYSMLLRKVCADANLLLPICEPGLLTCIDVFVLSFAISELVGSAESAGFPLPHTGAVHPRKTWLGITWTLLWKTFLDKATYSEGHFCTCDFPCLGSWSDDFSSWCIVWNGPLKSPRCWAGACMIFSSIYNRSGCTTVWSFSHARTLMGSSWD